MHVRSLGQVHDLLRHVALRCRDRAARLRTRRPSHALPLPIRRAARRHRALVGSDCPLAAQEVTPGASPAAGAIIGLVTDEDTGQPVADVILTVGYKGIKLAAITGADGRYRVENVPAGEAADVFGFHGGGYRYHNSIYDDHLEIVLQPGETYTYDFTVKQLNDPAGEPEVTEPALSAETAKPGDTVTFELTRAVARAASPTKSLPLAQRWDGWRCSADRRRPLPGRLTIPADTAPGDYPFAFFAASNECYDNNVFPELTLHVEAA